MGEWPDSDTASPPPSSDTMISALGDFEDTEMPMPHTRVFRNPEAPLACGTLPHPSSVDAHPRLISTLLFADTIVSSLIRPDPVL